MFTHFSNRLKGTVITLHPGEYYATADDTIIATVLGSCVAVALWDRKRSFGGLNHFMLPAQLSSGGPPNVFVSESGKYGMYAMDLLINEMMKLGSTRRDLDAKVFGGGSVLRGGDGSNRKLPQSNIDFALEYLAAEKIPIEGSDVGGTVGRKIFFYPRTFRVLLKRITGTLITDLEAREEEYLRKLRNERREGDATVF